VLHWQTFRSGGRITHFIVVVFYTNAIDIYTLPYVVMKYSRRSFLDTIALAGISLPLVATYGGQNRGRPKEHRNEEGAQRLPMMALKAWEALEYGMFIHFGMSTFTGSELPDGTHPSTLYAPARLDVDQWIQVARDAGMRYAVLTAKHVSGHCLWPSKYTDYHIGISGNKTDVVGAFVDACNKYGLMPGLYYCSWDNHHLFGSGTPTFVGWEHMYTTARYREFQLNQVEELLTQYGPIGEMWIDIPGALGHEGRRVQYEQIVQLQPDNVIMLNNGISNGTQLKYDYTWPTDLMAIERYLPTSNHGYNPWFEIAEQAGESKSYYIPGEVCDPIGYEWFYVESDPLRSVNELTGMRLVCRSRGTNLLLDVPPDRDGLIPKRSVDTLLDVATKYEYLSGGNR